MATSNVTNQIRVPAQVGILVIATLKRGFFRVDSFDEVVGVVSTYTDASGNWSLALERQSNIAPNGSYWVVQEFIPSSYGGTREWAILVQDTDKTLMECLTVPALLPSPSPTPGTDALFVHRAGTETITGVKTFSGDAYFQSGIPWIDAAAFGFGLAGNTPTQNRTALLAAMDAAKHATHAGRRAVVIPPSDTGYEISSGIDLSDSVYAGVTVMAFGGWNDTQHGRPPSVSIRSLSGPVFYGAIYSHMTFVGLSFFAPAGSPAFSGDYSVRCKFIECSATSTGAAPAWKFENSFWHSWDGGRSLSDAGQRTFDFITKNITATSLEVIGGNMRFRGHVFQRGNVRLYQTATVGFAAFAMFSFDECNTEAFVAPQALVDVQQAGGATNVIAEAISFNNTELADSTGTVAFINVGPTATARWIDFELARGTNGPYWTVEAGGLIYGIGGSGGVGANGFADPVTHGGYAVVNTAGHDIRNHWGVVGAATGAGTGSRYFRNTEAYARMQFGDFGIHAGPGSGVYDAWIQRAGVGSWAVPVLVKAGVPADGDFAQTPPNGTTAWDSSVAPPRQYVRIAGVWVGGAAT